MEALKLLARGILDPETEMHYGFVRNVGSAEGIHYHDFYEIFLITEGSIIHYVNDRQQILSAGAMVFIRPEDNHYYGRHNSNECQFINVAFSRRTLKHLFDYLGDPILEERFLSGAVPPQIALSQADKAAAVEKLEHLTLTPSTDKRQVKTRLRLLLADFILNYFLRYSVEVEAKPLWLEQLVVEMRKKENFREGLRQLQKLSEKRSEYVSRIFKKYYSKTPTDYINELRLNYAANMLIHSDTSILDIALDAGFGNLSHFYHLFGKQFDVSPKKFRELNQKVLIK